MSACCIDLARFASVRLETWLGGTNNPSAAKKRALQAQLEASLSCFRLPARVPTGCWTSLCLGASLPASAVAQTVCSDVWQGRERMTAVFHHVLRCSSIVL
ncbi:hypothetical protein IQ06DRAFT_2753 [Phaeosphaeriaceae sp. SRC1lsM3a]|nr:hypothetical protein IQ06DRAFT_2753 [Stagonospora sp. SRC1lsM3a]